MGFRFPLAASYYAEQMFDAGYTFVDGDHTASNARELQEMFVAHGANEVSARIGSSRRTPARYDDDTSLERGLARARLALDLGMPFNPLLFLSRNYGDMTGQPHPAFEGYPELELDAPWETLTIEQMADYLRRFARIAAGAILDTGVDVSVWNLGNEVDLGIAGVTPRPIPMEQWETVDGVSDWYRGPDAVDTEIGQVAATSLLEGALGNPVAWLEQHVWPHEATLLAAAADGVRSVDPHAKFSTHLGSSGFAPAFFRAMRAGGYAVDQPAISLYPTIEETSNEEFAKTKDTIRALMDELGVSVMINEFGYPAGPTDETFGDWKHALDGYPLTEEGQAKMFEDLVGWAVSEGLAGVNPWGPDLVVPIWEKMSFFRVEGNRAVARPILHSFQKAMERTAETTRST